MTKEEAIKKLADIIFYVSKMGYIPYDTDDELCAVSIAKKHIGELLPSLPSDLDEMAREKAREIFDAHKKYDIGEEKNRILLGLLELEAFAMVFYDNGAEWMAEQNDKDLSEKIASAYQLGLADKEKQMMSEAIECIVEDWNPESHPEITIPLNPENFSNGDRVRIIIVKEDSHE